MSPAVAAAVPIGRGAGAAGAILRARRQIAVDLIRSTTWPILQLGLLREYKAAGRVRHIGVTTTFEPQYEALEKLMQAESLDFIGVDYAVDNRTMEERIFPLAQELGIGVLVYAPFGRTRLWQKVEGKALPDWAADYDIATWGSSS